MKRITLIAGMASVATVATVMWSVPASAITCGSSACAVVHNTGPDVRSNNRLLSPAGRTARPACRRCDVLPLLALGLEWRGVSSLL